jgi:hypothetical protein
MSLYTSSSILNYTKLLIAKEAGTLELYYYGINLEEFSDGFIYIYESSDLKNFSIKGVPIEPEHFYNTT